MPTPHRLHTSTSLRRAALLVISMALGLLTGCASVYRVDSQVQSFARWSGAATQTPAATGISAAPQAPQRYQFERLPSQTTENAARGQADLEAIARTVLARYGWTPAEPGASARWLVQVNAAVVKLPRAPWEEPWNGFGYPGGIGGFGAFGTFGGFGLAGSNHVVTGGGQVIWTPVFIRLDLPYFERKVSLLIRNASNAQVVFEAHAAHDGRWNGSPELWGAMFDAALQDFPAPPAGVRQVNIDLPR